MQRGDHSSVTLIAISGQLVCASHALSSRPAGTVPSPISWALPYSSSSNSSGASDLQRAWPWHLSWSTWILSLAMTHSLLTRRRKAFARFVPLDDAQLLAGCVFKL